MSRKEIYSAPKATEQLIQTEKALLEMSGGRQDYGEAEKGSWV